MAKPGVDGDNSDPEKKKTKKKPKKKTIICFYCKLPGHMAARCKILESTLCVKCFQFGHTDFRCSNEMVFVHLEDI